jgi:hypothetical protein
VTAGGALVPARLRIDWRTARSTRPDGTVETKKFPVPVIDVDERLDALTGLAGAADAQALEPAEYRAAPTPEPLSLAEGLEAAARSANTARSGRAPAPIGELEGVPNVSPTPPDAPSAAVPAVLTAGEEIPIPPSSPAASETPKTTDADGEQAPGASGGAAGGSGPAITSAQRRRLWAIKTGAGMTDGLFREIIREYTGQESTGAIPVAAYDLIVTAVEKPRE